MTALFTYIEAYGLLALAVVGYWLLCAYCDQTENADGSYGHFPFKNRGRK